MDNARRCKIETRKRAYFELVAGTAHQEREKEHDTPCQGMEYNIKMPVLNDALHVRTHILLPACKTTLQRKADQEAAKYSGIIAAFTAVVYLPEKPGMPPLVLPPIQ
jgi:hypothetical protein